MGDRPRRSRPRILAVDDSLLIQRMIREFFEPAGYEVLVASNGQEGLDLAREHRPDVIISDIIMPVMDGWEFCELIRSDPTTTEIPFLFLTAVREAPKRIRGLRMGADDYLTKPFSREELLARVEVSFAKVERMRALKAAGTSVLSGHTSHLSISDLLQILTMNSKTGVLRLTEAGGSTGEVYFRDGRIVQACLDKAEGRKALFRLLFWDDARFEMDPLGELPAREGIRQPTPSVLMDGFTHMDDLRRLRDSLPPETTQFRTRVDLERGKADAALEIRDKAVLMEFQDGITLREVLDASPLEDLEVSRGVLKLMELGLVLPMESVLES